MTFNYTRIYYNAVFGALGGLLSWVLIGLLRIDTSQLVGLFLKDALQGAAVGAALGAALGAVDGLVFSRSIWRTLKGSTVGAIIGIVGGTVGLMIGEAIFLIAGGGVWPRAVGWGLFGLLVGSSEGVANRRRDKISYGALGGLLGGLSGGATYERLSLLLRATTHNRDLSLTIGGAVGLIILGACIGSLIGLVEDILKQAWFKPLWGPLEGNSISIPRNQLVTIGRHDRCDIILPGDPDIKPVHAELQHQGNDWAIVARDGPVVVHQAAGGQQTVSRHTLQNEDVIQLGRTRLLFGCQTGGG